ncbi:Hypothetical protein MexAM1_META1p3971 [Methylorubrum extorquens AM1]|uniref:Uncharacterized protein n=1 Tax=Methylorubrum extorquens (strain ATCC 14718 / DSM 1338 / JCM 2805 / NCIMB 9133 / AM1) TaxID=272630 RepID=C5B0R5_METEA|nr:Hypothetical protein MexAM1_META1p3971 [Methylorubrum extorquens AM1]
MGGVRDRSAIKTRSQSRNARLDLFQRSIIAAKSAQTDCQKLILKGANLPPDLLLHGFLKRHQQFGAHRFRGSKHQAPDRSVRLP